jgi:neutral ceramidase
MRAKYFPFLLLIGVLLLVQSLSAQEITSFQINKVEALPPVTGQLMAGFSSVDITPPPGLASGARSVTGQKKMKGFRTRLKCRVFCIRDAKGENVALVQLDLAFGSLIMHHQIAERIAEKTDIPISNIILTCTHTHSGPTGFFSSNFYNTNGGAVSGFEPTLYEFLTSQITKGILEAHANMKPAKIATGTIEVRGYSRNRAIIPFTQNPENADVDVNDPASVFEAINPHLYMMRIDIEENGLYKPIGAFTTFSIHGTGVGSDVDVFNGDLFAYAQRDLSWQIEDKYKTSWQPIHAFSNGTEGDMAPNLPYYRKNGAKEKKVVPLDWLAARKIGQGIGAKAWELFQDLDGRLKSDIKISVAAKEIDIRENNLIDDIKISKHPCVGTCTVAGAYENRSVMTYLIPSGSAMTRKRKESKKKVLDEQGNKRMIIGRIFRKMFPVKSYPSKVMFQLVQIDDMLLVPLPWEVTITAGNRMSNKIIEAYKENNITPPKYISISSLANDYLSYATTPEEYAIQNYEGSQTLYGKNTVPYITAQLHHLADDLLKKGTVSEFPEKWEVQLKTKHRFPTRLSKLEKREIVKHPFYKTGKEKKIVKGEDYWMFSWTDYLPAEIHMHEPIVKLAKSTDNKNWTSFKVGLQPMDDEGYDIEVRLEKKNKKYATYAAKWYNPTLEKGTHYRFVIYPRDDRQEVLYSGSFMVIP